MDKTRKNHVQIIISTQITYLHDRVHELQRGVCSDNLVFYVQTKKDTVRISPDRKLVTWIQLNPGERKLDNLSMHETSEYLHFTPNKNWMMYWNVVGKLD